MIYTKLYIYTQNYIDLRKIFINKYEFDKFEYIKFLQSYNFEENKKYIINIRCLPFPKNNLEEEKLNNFLDYLKEKKAISPIPASQEEIKKITLKQNYKYPYKDYLYKSIYQDLILEWFKTKDNLSFINKWKYCKNHNGLTEYKNIIDFLFSIKKGNAIHENKF